MTTSSPTSERNELTRLMKANHPELVRSYDEESARSQERMRDAFAAAAASWLACEDEVFSGETGALAEFVDSESLSLDELRSSFLEAEGTPPMLALRALARTDPELRTAWFWKLYVREAPNRYGTEHMIMHLVADEIIRGCCDEEIFARTVESNTPAEDFWSWLFPTAKASEGFNVTLARAYVAAARELVS